MFNFAWPWAFTLLALPLLVWWLYPRDLAVDQSALRIPELNDFRKAAQLADARSNKQGSLWFAIIVWVLLVTAAARPQWLGDINNSPESGRDLMLAVDISGSMRTPDFRMSQHLATRLGAAKWVVSNFVKRRQGDRIGLILFATRAYLYVPLTFDTKTLITMLNESFVGLAGDSTAIGDAIGVAIKRVEKKKRTNRVLILMTDGQNTDGTIDPLKAADLARQIGMKIYTVGIGGESRHPHRLSDYFRRRSRDEIDESMLRRIANTTGGRFFRADNTEELDHIYHELDQLEPLDHDAQRFRPRSEYYHWVLVAVLIMGVGYLINRSYQQRAYA